MANIEKLLYTIQEAQVALGISRSRVFILLKEKSIKSCKIGRRRLIFASSLRDFIDGLG